MYLSERNHTESHDHIAELAIPHLLQLVIKFLNLLSSWVWHGVKAHPDLLRLFIYL